MTTVERERAAFVAGAIFQAQQEGRECSGVEAEQEAQQRFRADEWCREPGCRGNFLPCPVHGWPRV